MEPQDDNGLFAQTGQDNMAPDGQTEGQVSDENGQVPTNEQAPGQDGGNSGSDDNTAVPAEDGMAEDEDMDDDGDTETEGETVAPAGAI